MPRKRIRQKHYRGTTLLPPERFQRKKMAPEGLRPFEPFSYSIDGKPQTMSEENFEALSARLPDACTVCSDHPRDIVLAYCPVDSQQWGAPEGKDRMIWYTLCMPCYMSPDWKERAENMLAARLGITEYERLAPTPEE